MWWWSLYVPPVVTICNASLTFNNSTCFPRSVFMCLVWLSEQTANASLYSSNWLVFITETQSVYSAVRDKRLNEFLVIFCLGSNTVAVCCYLHETVSSKVVTVTPSWHSVHRCQSLLLSVTTCKITKCTRMGEGKALVFFILHKAVRYG